MCLIIWCFLVESFQLKNIQKHSEKNCRKTGFHFKYTGVAVSSRFRIPYRVRVHCRRYAIMKMLLLYLHSILQYNNIAQAKQKNVFHLFSSTHLLYLLRLRHNFMKLAKTIILMFVK